VNWAEMAGDKPKKTGVWNFQHWM